MNTENCVVIGPAIMRYDTEKLTQFADVILAGNSKKDNEFKYAVAMRENILQDMLNSSSFRQTIVLAPQDLYKKYVFFEQIDELPSLPQVPSTGYKLNDLSEQSVALMLALWMEKKNIYLFGYDIQDLKERAILLSILAANPFANVFYTRKPNPAKIHLFDTYENVKVIDYNQFDEMANEK
jgi:hypothetical protein